jgi:PAS domain S-box-containing protein
MAGSLPFALLDQSPAVIFAKDVNGRYVHANPAFESLLGLSPGAALGRCDKDFFPADLAAVLAAHDAKVLASGTAQTFEEEVPGVSGAHTWLVCKFPLRDGAGQATAVGGIATEITQAVAERRTLEERARDQALSLMLATLESTADGILVVNSDGKIETFNRVFARMWRIPDEILGAKDDARALQFAIDQLREPQRFTEKIAYLYAHPQEESFDLLEFKDGRVFERYSRPQLVAGKVAGRVWSFRDVTERKRGEEELRWRTAFFEAQVDSAPDGILVVDSTGKKILQNRRMAEVWKIPPELEQDKDDTPQIKFVTGRTKNPQQFAEKVAYLYAHPTEISRDEIELIDGTMLDRYSAPVRGKDGKYYGRIWTFRDITEQKRLEEHLRQSQKMEAIGQLSGGVAHDFNNLLTAIMGHLGLLEGNPDITPEIAESLSEIGKAANRAATLTSQLLAFSRRQILQSSDVDLNAVVENMTKMLRRLLGEDVAMQIDYASEPLIVQGDPSMLEQVLLNLAVNARDAMAGGGTLRVVTRGALCLPPTSNRVEPAKSARFVHLAVSDTGSGIAPEILPRIFEPFFTTKEVGKGTGLGLATVFAIVQQHHGWIEVESEVGRGTTFHVFLPRIASGPSAAAASVPAVAPRGRGETILLVEDEPAVREMGTAALSRHGYLLLTANNGAEALDVWATHKGKISLLLTDLIMPGGMSGLELARQILRRDPGVRVIYTSGYSAEIAGRDLPMKAGVNYLAKPYELNTLLQTVRTALDGGASRPPF